MKIQIQVSEGKKQLGSIRNWVVQTFSLRRREPASGFCTGQLDILRLVTLQYYLQKDAWWVLFISENLESISIG